VSEIAIHLVNFAGHCKMKKKKLSDIWLKATVVGSLWATIEIILGSFFHNLRLPMAGTVLAMISVLLLVAFHRQWRENGLLWRAGLICALMKSISPSAILLGPMVGILTEAVLLEMAIRLLGGNLLGYIVGGAIALVSTIAHKVANLLIIYGFDFVNVMVNLYDYAVVKIGVESLTPQMALTLLFLVYALLGIVASVGGFVIGNKKIRTAAGNLEVENSDHSGKTDFFAIDPDQQFSVKLLFLHLILIVSCLFILSRYSLLYGSIFIVLYVLFAIFHYKRALRHLKKPFFWFQVLVLTFLASVFYNGFTEGDIYNQEGLLAGLQMNIRAILILVGFSCLSVELRNPVVKAVLVKRGFSQVYAALGLAFSVLPWILKNAPKPKVIIRGPAKSIALMLSFSDQLLDVFREKTDKPEVIIISGEKHSGKTTFTKKVVEYLKVDGYKIGGFLAPGYFEKNSRSAFDLQSVENGETSPLCSIHFTEGDVAGPFRFDKTGIEFGESLLAFSAVSDKHIVVIDEVGPLEMNGKGWSVGLKNMLDNSETAIMLVVRAGLVEAVKKQFAIPDAYVFRICNSEPEEVAKSIAKIVWLP
jgi:nucleoside-triphosphatase THEP1